jgi:hypothetical protein
LSGGRVGRQLGERIPGEIEELRAEGRHLERRGAMHKSGQALRLALAAVAMTGAAAFAPTVSLRTTAATLAPPAAARSPITAPALALSRGAAPRITGLGARRMALRTRQGATGLGMQEQGADSESEDYASALKTTGLWVAAAAAFGLGIGATMGTDSLVEYFTGYVLEESLSVDNLFVFILLFKYFKVPLEFQKRVLTYGIAGAIALRGAFISAGLVAIQSFRPVLLAFAGFLIFTSFKILTSDGDVCFPAMLALAFLTCTGFGSLSWNASFSHTLTLAIICVLFILSLSSLPLNASLLLSL